MPALQTPNEP